MSRKVVKLNLPELIRRRETKLNLDRRITQKEVAEAVGVSEPTIRRWMRNEVDELSIDLLGRFLTYFECSVSDLLIEETVDDGVSLN